MWICWDYILVPVILAEFLYWMMILGKNSLIETGATESEYTCCTFQTLIGHLEHYFLHS